MCEIASGNSNTGESAWCSVTTNRGGMVGGSGRQDQQGGDMCILMADPRCYMAETNISLLSNYPPIKKTNENNLGSISE